MTDLATGWQEVRLGEVGKIITGKTPSSKSKEFWGDDINFITPSDMKQDSKYITCTARHLSLLSLDKMKNLVLPENTVITSCIGSDMGKSYISKSISITNQQINSIIVNKEFNVDFILYALKIKQNFLRKLATGGSTMPILNKSDFSNIFISIPKEIDEQKRIAKVLSALDDKIENNRKINATLEAMAQALFKSWFVDFDPVRELIAFDNRTSKYKNKADLAKALYMDEATLDLFPSTFDENGLPLGWEVKTMQSLGQIKTGKTPSTQRSEYYGNDVPFLTIPDMHNNLYVTNTSKNLSFEGSNSQAKNLIPKGSIAFSCIATPGLVVLLHKPMHTNQQINSLIPENKDISNFLYFSLSHLGANIKNREAGSVFYNMNKTQFSKLEIIYPKDKLQINFSKKIDIMFNQILNNKQENQTLIQLRDTLLPQLLSGKLRIADVENFIKD